MGRREEHNIVENNITFFNLEGLKGDDPAAIKNYDIGIVDENGLNYDIFGVALGRI